MTSFRSVFGVVDTRIVGSTNTPSIGPPGAVASIGIARAGPMMKAAVSTASAASPVGANNVTDADARLGKPVCGSMMW